MTANDIYHLFLLLNIWLCLTSLVMVAASAVALSIPLSIIGVGFFLPVLLFYFIYVEDRRRSCAEDRINQPYRTHLVRRYRNGLLFSELLALVAYEVLLLFLIYSRPDVGMGFFFLGQLPIAILAIYGHLKRYPTFDSLAVGGTWAFVIVFTVLVSTGHSVSREVGLVFVAWFLIGFAGVESRNVQDIEGDVGSDKTTLAAHLGVKKTRILEVLLKTTGVVIFFYISGVSAASLVVGYLLLLRFFRTLTHHVIQSNIDRLPIEPEGNTYSNNHNVK